MSAIRIPEKCPWCGETENIRQDGVRTGTYHCGAMLLGWSLWGGMHKSHSVCPHGNTFEAALYRQTLSWRKRLSQHTGVPLRLVPEWIRGEPHPTWRGGIWFERCGKRWELRCWHGDKVDQIVLPTRELARRKLLASQ
jgi:hypothetical protein